MKYEFGSPEWMIAIHGVIAGRAGVVGALHPELTFSMCEVYTDAPVHLSGADRKIAWHFRLMGWTVEFDASEADDVDYKVVCDYQGILPAGRFDTRGDPARLAELKAIGQALADAGKLKILGDPAKRPEVFGSTHDSIARLTR
jgi:hypothetical protein